MNKNDNEYRSKYRTVKYNYRNQTMDGSEWVGFLVLLSVPVACLAFFYILLTGADVIPTVGEAVSSVVNYFKMAIANSGK